MRRLLLALTGLVLAFAASAPAGPRAPVPERPAVVTATTFVVSGRGWGHGVGMSQYGALGFANEGWTYDQILGHFYVGAELGPAPVARVRVLVGEAKGAVKLRSEVPFRVRDVFGKTYALAAGELVLGPKLWVTVNGAPTELVGPILFLPGTEPLELDRPYRGQIEVGVIGQKLDVVNVVGLEPYLQGVVPQEMPSAWPDEALKAQAVAARSYALSHRLSGKGFDLYADVRSQVYGGIRGESPRTTAAVQATKAEVLLWEGKPIDALFHSTSGGRTVDAAEVFGKPVPYLVSVDDPHSDLSPVNRWGPTPVSEAAVRKGLKLRTPLTALQLTRGASGRVLNVNVATTTGTSNVTGAALRAAAGLRSTWITGLATLSLTRPGGPALYGRQLTVTGKAAGVEGAVLSQRIDGVWTRVAGPGAALSVKVKLQAPASFRISAGTLAGAVLKVPVAPVVTARADAVSTVSGAVKPPAPGTTVELQLDSGSGWSTTAQATTGPNGEYTISPPEPGLYRVRVAPAQGFAEGLSGQIELR
jgi:SpoIID/LytB domain protein